MKSPAAFIAFSLALILPAGFLSLCANNSARRYSGGEGLLAMGMNIGDSPYYFSRNLMFNDVMKTASGFRSVNWSETLNYELAADGYPAEINAYNHAVRAVVLINNIYTGDYVFLYDGDGDFIFSGGIDVVSAEPTKINLRLNETDLNEAGGQRWITVTRSNRANRARNFRLIPKEFENDEENMPLFRRDFLDGLRTMHALRYMDAVGTNGAAFVTWNDRSKPGDFSYLNRGLPWEYLIELSNTLNTDGWFCVPHTASDNYIENLARLIKERLNPGLKAYVEYSNEIWNFGFEQARWIASNAPGAADAFVSRDLAALESQAKFGNAQPVKTAYMMARVFRIFERVFTGADRSRLVTVGAIQTNNWIEYTKETIEYWQKNNCVPDAIAGAGYFGFETSNWDDSSIPQSIMPRRNADELNSYFHNKWMLNPSAVTANDVINAIYTIWDYAIAPAVISSAQAIKASGAKFIVYEGGQHIQPHNQEVWAYNRAIYDAQISPRMYDLYIKNYELHASLDCALFMNFTYLGQRESQYGSWGVLENTGDVYSKNLMRTAPKYQAMLDANTGK
jgi:hypothetical protein